MKVLFWFCVRLLSWKTSNPQRFCVSLFSVNMLQEEKLLADFIQQNECAFTTIDDLNISMLRLVLKKRYIWSLTDSLVALVSANPVLHICILSIYPLFSTTKCHIDNMQHYLCVERSNAPLALVPKGLTPSVDKLNPKPSCNSAAILERPAAETCHVFIFISCACVRQGLIQAWKRPLHDLETMVLFRMRKPASNVLYCCCFLRSSLSSLCHAAQPAWLNSSILISVRNVKCNMAVCIPWCQTDFYVSNYFNLFLLLRDIDLTEFLRKAAIFRFLWNSKTEINGNMLS